MNCCEFYSFQWCHLNKKAYVQVMYLELLSSMSASSHCMSINREKEAYHVGNLFCFPLQLCHKQLMTFLSKTYGVFFNKAGFFLFSLCVDYRYDIILRAVIMIWCSIDCANLLSSLSVYCHNVVSKYLKHYC